METETLHERPLADDGDAAAAAAAEEAVTVTEWLARVGGAERAVVQSVDASEDDKLAASAHVMQALPGELLDRRALQLKYKAMALQLHPDKAGNNESIAAFQLLLGASTFLSKYLAGHNGVRAPPRLPPLTPHAPSTPTPYPYP